MRSLGRSARPPVVATVAVVAAVSALTMGLVACTSGPDEPPGGAATPSDPQIGIDPTVPVEEGELPEAGPTDLAGLDQDARGLALGDEYVVGGNHTTVLEVRRPLPSPGDAPRPDPGHEWAGARVRTCFETEQNLQLEIGSYLFSAVSDDSYSYPGVQPEDARWPLPQYPGYGRLAPGQCTSGWIAMPVPTGATLTSIVQSAVTTDPVSEWTVPADAW